jgi:hypothetical protein
LLLLSYTHYTFQHTEHIAIFSNSAALSVNLAGNEIGIEGAAHVAAFIMGKQQVQFYCPTDLLWLAC